MSRNKRLVLISLLIVVAAAMLLGLRLRQSKPRITYFAASASVGGGGVVSHTSGGPGSFAATTRSRSDSKRTSQRPVLGGGAGADKARPFSPVKPPSTPGVPSEVLDAAETGLPFFLGQIPPGSKELYGFGSTDDLSAARLGGPSQMLTITPAAIEKSSFSTTVSSLLSETSMWFFPIKLGNESKAMLVVDRDEGGTWKAVSLGYAGLGHELNGILAQWPESKGFHPQLIAVFQAKQFYFNVPQVDDFNLTPIRSALAAQGQPQNYGTLGLVSSRLKELKPIVLRAEIHPTR